MTVMEDLPTTLPRPFRLGRGRASRDYFSSLIEMLRNWTSEGGPVQTPSFF